MQLNQNYVMSEAAYTETGKKKDVEHIEQLDRELRHMERSIATLKINAIKQEERDKNEIKKKTKENTSLVVELNSIKLEEKILKSEIMKQDQMIKDLDQKLVEKKKSLAQDLVTAKNEAAIMLQTHGINPGKDMRIQGDEERGLHKATSKGSAYGSQGNFFTKKKENLEDKARILELVVSKVAVTI